MTVSSKYREKVVKRHSWYIDFDGDKRKVTVGTEIDKPGVVKMSVGFAVVK